MSKRVIPVISRAKNSIIDVFSSRFGVRSLSETQTVLEDWLQTPFGQRLMAQERYHLDQLLRCIFGYHMMQLSISRKLDLSGDSPINHRFQFIPSMLTNKTYLNKPYLQGAITHFEQLPLASESIDVGILHHVLDYSPDPHHILSEASRVIIPHGHLLIVGFNPWSVSGLCKSIARVIVNSPQWRYHSLPLGRIIHWLHALDFEPVCQYYDYYGWPSDDGYCSRVDTLGRKLFPGCGAFYVLLARKHVMQMTPLKPARQTFKALSTWGKASPMPRKQK